MLVTTQAIVLNLQRHNDRSHILHAYTAYGGRMNFMLYGVGSKKKSSAVYTPLSRIEITADIRPDIPIPTVKEAHLLSAACNQSSLTHTSVKLFIAEMLYRILRHPMPDEAMYQFLVNSLSILDNAPDINDFHTSFLAGFAARLGFAIDETEHPELLRTPVSRADRQLLLRQLCDYYAIHLDDFQYPLSLDVLTEVFD